MPSAAPSPCGGSSRTRRRPRTDPQPRVRPLQRRAPISLDGIVVHLQNYRDSDRIVEVLTADHGRVSLLGRGARASRRRFAGALDLFVSLRMEVVPRGSLWALNAAEVLAARVDLRADLERIERAALLVDCARALTAEGSEAASTYEALRDGLDACAAGELGRAAETYPRLLAAAGLLPDLGRCHGCGAPGGPFALDAARAMVVCARCEPSGSPLSEPVLAVLNGGPCTEPTVARWVEDQVAALVEQHAGRPLRSRSLRGGNAAR